MSSGGPSVVDAAKALGILLERSTQAGLDLLDSFKLPQRQCGSCEIPPPCWEPQPIGDVTTRAAPGGKAVLRLDVVNCGSSPRKVTVEATNALIAISPASATLGPYEDAVVGLTLNVPATAMPGERETSVVWVRGCRTHYLRWTVEVSAVGVGSSTAIVEDCPDLLHHWYDHFYCNRACPNPQR
jgi:hypothetical protein